MTALGGLPGESVAYAVSADGSTIVGSINHPDGEAFRWTSGGGMTGLGDLAGGVFGSAAFAISGDGSIVVGGGQSESGDEAFVWDPVHGMRELDQVLVALGLGAALDGWTLTEATGISGDGVTIVGTGINPSGDSEAWLAVIPEPGTASLLGVGLVALAAARRRPRRSK